MTIPAAMTAGQAGSMDGLTLAVQTILAGQQAIASDVAAMRADMAGLSTRQEVTDARAQTADEWHRDVEARVRVLESRQLPADLDGRIRALERFRWTLAGIASAGGAAAGWVGQYLSTRGH